ncbi:MAG: bifunctional (p)ppGpp synthetase/guanosine-3',5'-bis(diphosphate) 3'-pyrophosphohydrolase [Nitrospira sp.]|nr:MAG: bifunctional (p)ppGpp synthetase/guanosine-3',5'-bis(diphosphate) 3'-pyrophosphohydrolase [Nitrospira sp.]
MHTEVGNHCVGAKVNGKIVPLKHQLKSGDTVEILTAKTQVPHKDWVKFVRTSRAKTKIKHWLKVEEQQRSVEIGRRLLERECRHESLSVAQTFKSERLQDVARELGYNAIDEMEAAIGYGKLPATQVVQRLIPGAAGRPSAEPRPAAPGPPPTGRPDERAVRVKGSRDVLMQLSKCCNPVPGDKIMAYITRGRGLTIHSVGCPNLEALDYDRERLVEVDWETAPQGVHPVKISVLAVDKTGVLANVSSSIADCNANISRAEITTREDMKASLDFVIDVVDTVHLDRVLKSIERVEGVITARRVRSWQDTQA